MATDTWFSGPPLPFPMWVGEVLKTSNSFITLGGAVNPNLDLEESTDIILEFDPIGLAWMEREERLPVARSGFYTIDVEPNDYCV